VSEEDARPEDLGAYELLAEALPHLVWFARSDGTVTFYNQRMELYGGLEAPEGGVYDWSPIVHPDDLEHTERAWQQATANGSPYECEHRVRMADGSYRWHLSRALPLGSGETMLWFGTATDTQILAETRSALAESEARMRTVFSGIDQGYCVCELVFDTEGEPVDYRFLETNPQFEQASGLRDAAGRTALEMVPSLERHWIETYAAVALGGEPIRFQQDSPAMGRHFDVFATPVAPIGRFALVFADITERHAALQALQESEQRFRNMADHAPVMIWVTDQHGECTYLNRRWYEFTGQSEHDALGRGWLDASHPEDRDVAWDAFSEAAARGRAFSVDYRLRRHDGTYLWAVDAAAPRFGADGRFLGYVGSVLDITERKEAERALADQRDREHEISRRLQHSMLPSSLVEDPRLEIATAYLASTDMLEVGGDWYETFQRDDGRIGVAVGDVVGHDIEAAGIMGQLRAGLVALAPHADDPAQLLCDLDRFAQENHITDFATSVCIFLDPDDGTIEYSSAGHLPPVVYSPEGRVRWLSDALSFPLGVFPVAPRPTATDRLEPGEVLLAFSDGLVERRNESIEVGLQRLAAAIATHGDRPAQELCHLIVDALTGRGGIDDDIVIVNVRRRT
jgi:PAS domain S-box-containing protein